MQHLYLSNIDVGIQLDAVLNTSIEEHSELFRNSNVEFDEDYISVSFGPIFQNNLDALLEQILSPDLRLEFLSKAKYRYGYLEPKSREVTGVDFVHPLPSMMVKQWSPNDEMPF